MPGLLKRHRERRLLRARRREREDRLLELGALVFELHRQGQRNPELLLAQAAALDEVDRDVRLLEGTLDPTAEQQASGEWTGEWEQPEEGWGETGDWQQTGEWESGGEPQSGEWQPEHGQDAAWDQTVEWDAPSEEHVQPEAPAQPAADGTAQDGFPEPERSA